MNFLEHIKRWVSQISQPITIPALLPEAISFQIPKISDYIRNAHRTASTSVMKIFSGIPEMDIWKLRQRNIRQFGEQPTNTQQHKHFHIYNAPTYAPLIPMGNADRKSHPLTIYLDKDGIANLQTPRIRARSKYLERQ